MPWQLVAFQEKAVAYRNIVIKTEKWVPKGRTTKWKGRFFIHESPGSRNPRAESKGRRGRDPTRSAIPYHSSGR